MNGGGQASAQTHVSLQGEDSGPLTGGLRIQADRIRVHNPAEQAGTTAVLGFEKKPGCRS